MRITLSLLIVFCYINCAPPAETKKTSISDPNYNPETQLERLGIELPEVTAPVANYVKAVQTGNLLFLSGSGPKKPDGEYIVGKVGQELSIKEGYEAARITGREKNPANAKYSNDNLFKTSKSLKDNDP